AWFQTPGAYSGAIVSSQHFIVVSFGKADDLVASMEWRPGLFRHVYPQGYGVELTKQLGGGTPFSHTGLVATMTEVPVARLGQFSTSVYTVRAVYVPHWLIVFALSWFPARWLALRWRS